MNKKKNLLAAGAAAAAMICWLVIHWQFRAFESILVAALLIICILFALRMVSQKYKNDKELRRVNLRYMDLINNIQGGVITCIYNARTASSEALYINEGWTELTGYTLEELNKEYGGNPKALVYPEDRESADQEFTEQKAEGSRYRLQYRVARKDGSIIWVLDRGVITTDENGNIQNQSIITEVTDIKEMEEQLRTQAQTDPLTGLYNKSTTTLLTNDVLKGQEERLHALMVLDIDNFKGINDNLGHIFGDTVLIEVSERLKRLFRNQDIVGRIGGDEFMILMKDISSKEVAEKKAAEVCATFRNTYVGEHGSYKISCSIGIAFSTGKNDYRDMFDKADIALYKAKTKGKDQYIVSDEEDTARPAGVGCIRQNTNPSEKDSGELEMKERFFELLYGSLDFGGSINMALSLLGRIMEADRAYVFENSQDNRLTANTYEWCADGISPVMKKLQSVKATEIKYWDLFDENGIFACQNGDELTPEIREALELQRVRSFIQIAIKENAVIRGFIGVDSFSEQRKRTKETTDLMLFVAKVMGTFILKERAEEEKKLYNQNKIDALDSLPNSIYVIDDEFRLHYMNNKAQETAPSARLGDCCHKVFMKNAAPCEGCPAQKCRYRSANAEIYNPIIHMKFISSASMINWQGKKNMKLICCQDITNISGIKEYD